MRDFKCTVKQKNTCAWSLWVVWSKLPDIGQQRAAAAGGNPRHSNHFEDEPDQLSSRASYYLDPFVKLKAVAGGHIKINDMPILYLYLIVFVLQT